MNRHVGWAAVAWLAALAASLPAAEPVEIRSQEFTAQWDCGELVGLRDAGGTVYVERGEKPLELTIHRVDAVHRARSAENAALPGGAVRQRLAGFDAEASAEIDYQLDPSGDLVVTPRCTAPAGVWGVSWSTGAIPLDYAILVPGNSGLRLTRATPGGTHTFDYPMGWEAQLVVVEGPQCGFSIWADDPQGRFKRLTVERRSDGWHLTLTAINDAPFDALTACESIPWHVNVYRGDWRVPAGRYRAWMEEHFRPTPVARQRPEWVRDIRCLLIVDADPQILAPLAERVDPRQTVLYVPAWRAAGYDRDYPSYDRPIDGLGEFFEAAHRLGFRVMLHVNYFGVDPLNPLFARFEPHQVCDPWGKHEKLWWLWERAEPVIRFAYINPAYKPWRDEFVRAMTELCRRFPVDALHLDQTLCIFNDHQGRIDGQSMIDGNVALHRELRAALPEVALSGEGLNEVTCRYEAFAQRHVLGLNHSEGTYNRRWLACAHPISSYLLRPYTVINGYLGCASPGSDQLYAAWNEAYEHWGVIPTTRIHRSQLDRRDGFWRQFYDEVRFWADERLQIDLDGDWPADVAFPFRTASGQRVVRTVDGRLVAGERTISRTLSGATQLRSGGAIAGWQAYDGDRLFGLDPEHWYPCFPGTPDPESPHVAALPKDAVLGGFLARPELALLETRSANTVVADFIAQIDRATCGSQPFGHPGSQWQGADAAGDGASFTPASDSVLTAHPPWKGGTGVAFARYQVELPADGELALETGVALEKEALQPGRSDGVTFGVAVEGASGGRLEQTVHCTTETPERLALDLTSLAGQTATVTLSVDPGPARNPNFDWARWHQPRIVRSGGTPAGVALAGTPPYTLALDPRGEQPVARNGSRLEARVLQPGAAWLVPGRPAAVALPWNLAAGKPVVAFLSDAGQELVHPQYGVIRPEQLSVEGVVRPGLFVHPPDHGRALACFPGELPREAARFTCWVGLRDGSKSEGVVVSVQANGRELVRRRILPGPWTPLEADLRHLAGQACVLVLVTDADGSYSCDWTCWGEPAVVP